MPPKTHRNSVVAIPTEDSLEPIQAIRRQHDRQINRWMPHVNLLYPFVPRDQFDCALPLLTRACAEIPSFDVTLERFRFFTHRSDRSTVWLDPTPKEAFVQLQSALFEAFPSYDEQSKYAAGFSPHLSVGQSGGKQALRALIKTLETDWAPRSLASPA